MAPRIPVAGRPTLVHLKAVMTATRSPQTARGSNVPDDRFFHSGLDHHFLFSSPQSPFRTTASFTADWTLFPSSLEIVRSGRPLLSQRTGPMDISSKQTLISSGRPLLSQRTRLSNLVGQLSDAVACNRCGNHRLHFIGGEASRHRDRFLPTRPVQHPVSAAGRGARNDAVMASEVRRRYRDAAASEVVRAGAQDSMRDARTLTCAPRSLRVIRLLEFDDCAGIELVGRRDGVGEVSRRRRSGPSRSVSTTPRRAQRSREGRVIAHPPRSASYRKPVQRSRSSCRSIVGSPPWAGVHQGLTHRRDGKQTSQTGPFKGKVPTLMQRARKGLSERECVDRAVGGDIKSIFGGD